VLRAHRRFRLALHFRAATFADGARAGAIDEHPKRTRVAAPFLLVASRNPAAHTSLIWFTVWSSVVHAVIMAVQALTDGAERGHLLGDVPALLVVAIVLAALTPRDRVA
jgi:hypothetical protein